MSEPKWEKTRELINRFFNVIFDTNIFIFIFFVIKCVLSRQNFQYQICDCNRLSRFISL